MKNFNSRNAELRSKFNSHFQKLTNTDVDFYDTLANEDILELKTVLSDINNLLTYKLTLTAGDWISNYFNLNEEERFSISEKIDSTKPNAKGYDIIIDSPIKIVAEVKCNVPVKGGSKFGAMQSKKLIEDVQKLLSGKPQVPNTSEYLKFLFIINIESRSEGAMLSLTKKTKLRVENEERINRNLIRESMIILSDDFKGALNPNYVYLKTLNLNNSLP